MHERVRKILNKVVNNYRNQENDIVNEGMADSFEYVEIISELEKEFDIMIPIEEVRIEDLDSVTGICGLIERCMKR